MLDVLIVGSGPAGAATAAGLADRGWRVMLVDREQFPRPKPCAEFMTPSATAILRRLGVLEGLRAVGASPLGLRVFAGGASLRGDFAGHDIASGARGLSCARTDLDAALLNRAIAAGAEFRLGTVTSLLYDRGAVGGAVVRGPDGKEAAVRARLTVGADGLRSVVARRIGRRRQRGPRRIAFVARAEGVSPWGEHAEMHVGDRRYVGLNPLGGGSMNVSLVVPFGEARAARGRTAEFVREQLALIPSAARRIPPGTIQESVMATGPFSVRSRRVVVDGAALVGDAAEFFDPFTGDGIYSALAGAEMLTRAADFALQGDGAVSAAALAAYETARRRTFRGKWAIERHLGYAIEWPWLFRRAVRNLAVTREAGAALVNATAGLIPASRVLNPAFLGRAVA